MTIDRLKVNEEKLENIKKYSAEQKKTLTGYPTKDLPWLKYYPKESIKKEIPKCTAYELIYNKMKNNDDYVAI